MNAKKFIHSAFARLFRVLINGAIKRHIAIAHLTYILYDIHKMEERRLASCSVSVINAMTMHILEFWCCILIV